MRALSISIAMLILLLSSCCKEKYTDDEFVLDKTSYLGNQIKTDGYYYSQVEGEDYYRLYVFYRDGIVLIPGVFSNPDEYISNFVAGFNKEIKDFWGLYVIEDSSISIEYYVPKMIEGMPAYLKTGDIINDTTFVITEVKRSKNGSERKTISETYRYKYFDEKPDSTNSFIK
ncbi:MAG: hypothetical protein QM786_15965 [Breznakibacter sp.]